MGEEFSLRELINLLRFKPDPTGVDAGPVIKPNAGSGLTTSLENQWRDRYNDAKQKAGLPENVPFLKQVPAMAWIDLGLKNLVGVADGLTPKYKADLLLGTAGVGTSSRYGINYQTQNTVDGSDILREGDADALSGLASLNLGKFAAWHLGGKKKQQEEINRANQLAFRTNMYGGDMTSTTGIQLDLAKKYGNQESLVLFAAGGKDEEGGTPAVVQPFETKDSDGKLTTYFGGKLGKDSIMDYVKDGDTIFSLKTPVGQAMTQLSMKINKNKGKNLDLANRVARSTVEAAKEEQKMYRAAGLLPEEKVAYAANGIDNWGNVVQTLAGIGTALGGFFLAKNSKVHRPDIRVANPYEGRALADLYSLRPDNLSIIRGLRDAEARGRYQIASAGGLGAGQRALANVALTANTLNSIANALAQSQDRFNALRSLAATTALNTGNATAQRNMAALQYNDAAYQQASSARQNIMRDYLAQIPGMLGQYYKNWYTQQMGKNMLALYLDSNDIERKKYGI